MILKEMRWKKKWIDMIESLKIKEKIETALRQRKR